MIYFDQVTKIYNDHSVALDNVTFTVNRGEFVSVVGHSGAGKTTFVQGFAKALGIRQRIMSPTFLIFRSYKIPSNQVTNDKATHFYHIDAYRISSPKELIPLDFESLLHTPNYILLIEWADKIKQILPKDTLWIRFSHGKTPSQRIIDFRL